MDRFRLTRRLQRLAIVRHRIAAAHRAQCMRDVREATAQLHAVVASRRRDEEAVLGARTLDGARTALVALGRVEAEQAVALARDALEHRRRRVTASEVHLVRAATERRRAERVHEGARRAWLDAQARRDEEARDEATAYRWARPSESRQI